MKKILVVFCMLLLSIACVASAAEVQVVAGAGPSTKVVQLFVDQLSKQPAAAGYEFQVPPRSAKHAGGLKNTDSYIFGRTGRPLNAAEASRNKAEIFLARVPIAFAVGSNAGVASLTLEQLQKVFVKQVINWSQVGGNDAPIVLVGREPTEALYSVLKEDYPFFKDLVFDQIFKKDHQVVNFLKSPDGANAIAFGALPNFNEVAVVEVGGFSSGVGLGLVYDKKNSAHPLVQAAAVYAMSPDWGKQVEQFGLMTANK